MNKSEYGEEEDLHLSIIYWGPYFVYNKVKTIKFWYPPK